MAAPHLAAALPRHAKADDLARFPILTHAKNTRPYAEVVDYFTRDSRRLSRPVTSSNLAAYLNMTLDGLGIATDHSGYTGEGFLAGFESTAAFGVPARHASNTSKSRRAAPPPLGVMVTP